MYLIALCGKLVDLGSVELGRNQAICAANLVRIAKFMRAVLALINDEDEHGDVIYALIRPIAESVVNLRYLAQKDDPDLYDRFVRYSFGPEHELYNIIQANIASRDGDVLPIETQMLNSVNHYCELSGLKIEDISPDDKDRTGDVRQKINAIGEPWIYAIAFRSPSHAVHGTWIDLLMRHLSFEDGKYTLKLDSDEADYRILLPIALFALEGAAEYLRTFYGEHGQLWPLHERIDDLCERLAVTVQGFGDHRDEAWKARNQGAEKTEPLLTEERETSE